MDNGDDDFKKWLDALRHAQVGVGVVVGTIVFMFLMIAGCAGCLSPPDIAEFPNGMPVIEKFYIKDKADDTSAATNKQ